MIKAALAVLLTISLSLEASASEAIHDEALAGALREIKPRMSPKLAAKHVEWARAAVQGTEIEPERVLGMAFRESSWNPFSVSRLECLVFCVRVTGILKERWPTSRGPYFCGVMQTHAASWKACQREAATTPANYRKGALHLQEWLDTAPCSARSGEARMTCALLGYGGGLKLIRAGSHPYPGNVRRATNDLRSRARALSSEID